MRIQKRNGKYEQMSFDKIKIRNNKLANDQTLGKIKKIDTDLVSQKVIQQITDGISTEDIDILSADICISMSIDNPYYGELASRIYTNNLQKKAPKTFKEAMETLFINGVINETFINNLRKNEQIIEESIVHSRDYLIDYFGLKTLEKGYLLKVLNKDKNLLMETPQYMWMRVALALHEQDTEKVVETYENLSLKNFIHATPTLFNAGTNRPQLSSCFLLGQTDDVKGIFKTMGDVAQISKHAGGIGLTCTDIRAKGSIIRGTNGRSDGILPMLKVYNEISRYINQAGKRNGSFACFVKDTKVYTDKGIKNIQDVELGDNVVTHKHRLRPVSQLHKNLMDDRELYRVSIEGSKDIYVTGNHKFLSYCPSEYPVSSIEFYWNSVDKIQDYLRLGKKFYVTTPVTTSINDKETFIDILDYKDEMYKKITYLKIQNDTLKPVTEVRNNIGMKMLYTDISIKQKWNFDIYLARLFGIFLNDGFVKLDNEEKPVSVVFNLDKTDTGTLNIVVDTCCKKMGISPEVQESSISNILKVEIKSVVVATVFKCLFSKRKVVPSIIFNSSKDIVQSFIKGVSKNNTVKVHDKQLLEQLFHISRNNGILSKYNKDCSLFTIPTFFNKSFLNVDSITKVNSEEEYVYTLGVEEDHSYTVEGVLVENCYIEPWHADVEDFLEMKKNTGDSNLRARDLFYGLWVPDIFMEKVEKDEDWYLMCPDECKGLVDAYSDNFKKLYEGYIEKGMYRKKIKARDLWNSILVSQTESGTPYICYKDSVNTKNNQENLGTITSSNLCVAPETMILTSKGYYNIKNLENQEVKVWNGEKFTKTVVKKTGDKQKLIRVYLSNGSFIDCTKYHKFYIVNELSKIEQVEAQNLRDNMVLIKSEFPIITDGDNNYKQFYDNQYRFKVPINYSLNIKLSWLEAFVDKYGYFCNKDSVEISHIDKGFLTDVKYLLQTLGCDPKLFDASNRGYKLVITIYDIAVLNLLGFQPKTLNIQITYPDINDKTFNTVEYVEDNGRISDTYCFTETERGMGVFNGVLTGNCVEIMIKHDENEYGVCNISSLSLGNCVKDGKFNFDLLANISRIATINLNKVIDLNYYPTPETLTSNMNHRPIAIGVQGLYDAFIKLRLPFTSKEAKELNKKIFECIQYNALKTSCELAKKDGKYSSFKGSPASKGMFQHNLWGVDEIELTQDWETLRKDVIKYGLRNSLVTALPPTASTANILGNTSSFETVTSNIFTRTVLSGNFPIVNKYLVNDLININMWSSDIKDQIILANGSVQNIKGIPQNIKDLYRTTWETSQKDTIDMSADRSPFIDQSQSLNIFMANATIAKLSSMHFYGWKKGLKTGSYYIRSQPISGAEKITVQNKKYTDEEALACSIDNKEACSMCEG